MRTTVEEREQERTVRQDPYREVGLPTREDFTIRLLDDFAEVEAERDFLKSELEATEKDALKLTDEILRLQDVLNSAGKEDKP